MLYIVKKFEPELKWIQPFIMYDTGYDKKELEEVYQEASLRDKVAEVYQDDFIKFNYKFSDYKNLYTEKNLDKETKNPTVRL